MFHATQPSYYIQLELFPETPEQRLSREVDRLRGSLDKMRKSLHAKNGELSKHYSELKHKMEVLERDICRTKVSEEQGMFL